MHPKRRTMILLGMAIMLCLIVAVVLLQDRHGASSPSPSDDARKAHPEIVSVQVVKPQRRDMVRRLSVPGNISPLYQATLYGKVSGYLKWIGFDKGDRVKKGQLLAVIDAPEVEDRYRHAEADYTIKKITSERLRSVWTENKDVIAKQDVDVAEAAAQGAKHLRDSQKTLLEYTKVYAPFDGTITARFADPGALIQSATGSATQAVPLFTIMDMDIVRVYVSVPQEMAYLAKPGIPATLTIPGSPPKEIKGSITRTTEALDPATRTLLVEIDLPNENRELQPGTFIQVTLALQQHHDTLVIPPAAIVSSGDQQSKSIFVVKDGHVHNIPIQTGIDDGVWVEVTSGLTGDEDVVVVGKGGLQEGQEVRASAYNLPNGKPARQKL
ncbi:MAG TPA: efflux RND transporter periplasmic adaptor subunit [Nitrospiraceae bacterium]|nr:efflux RND transporter periplasmic adaptor subunit [Nitrospiraceae bacterium]